MDSKVFDLFRLKNTDIESEPLQIKQEKNKKLVCIIDNQGNPVNHLDEGIKAVNKNCYKFYYFDRILKKKLKKSRNLTIKIIFI